MKTRNIRKITHAFEEQTQEGKGIEFTHFMSFNEGWQQTPSTPQEFAQLTYLGRCRVDGDMFATVGCGLISIYKGHLNDGTW